MASEIVSKGEFREEVRKLKRREELKSASRTRTTVGIANDPKSQLKLDQKERETLLNDFLSDDLDDEVEIIKSNDSGIFIK